VAKDSYVLQHERDLPVDEQRTPVVPGSLIFLFKESDGKLMELPHTCSTRMFEKFNAIGGWFIGDHAATFNEKLERISREQNATKSTKKRPREEESSEEDAGKRSEEACWHIPSSRVI
jgi:hypothetical protein